MHKELGGDTAGQLTPAGQRDIPDHVAPSSQSSGKEKEERETFCVMVCLPKPLLGVMEPGFPRMAELLPFAFLCT